MKEEDFKRDFKAIVIGGSAGSLQVLLQILNKIPADFDIPIILCCHRLKHIKNGFVEALEIKSKKKITEPEDKEVIRKNKVYLAPANYHMSIELGNSIALTTEEMINNSRPSIDITFESAAYVYKEKLLGILLTGANKDGAWGIKEIDRRGGVTIVQDPASCLVPAMPLAALSMTKVKYILNIDQIIKLFNDLHKYHSHEKTN